MYYLYRHTRLDTGVPFYIGIGKKPKVIYPSTEYRRAYEKTKRNTFWKNIANKTNYKIDILYESESREEILEKEKELVGIYISAHPLDGFQFEMNNYHFMPMNRTGSVVGTILSPFPL